MSDGGQKILDGLNDIVAGRVSRIHEKIVDDVPQLQRGIVWCRECGNSEKVNSAECLRSGWPKCCGQTMSISSPDEQDE